MICLNMFNIIFMIFMILKEVIDFNPRLIIISPTRFTSFLFLLVLACVWDQSWFQAFWILEEASPFWSYKNDEPLQSKKQVLWRVQICRNKILLSFSWCRRPQRYQRTVRKLDCIERQQVIWKIAFARFCLPKFHLLDVDGKAIYNKLAC